MAIVLVIVISAYQLINDQAIITKLFTIAGYTYGPLLGLYTFGLFTHRKTVDKAVPFLAIVSPIFTYYLTIISPKILWGYQLGFELLIINGAIMFLGLFFTSKTSAKH